MTSAALILFFAFAALASAPGTDIKVLGTALGVGILIDATIVRALLVPALVSLFGALELVAAGVDGAHPARRAVAAGAASNATATAPTPSTTRSPTPVN